MKEGMDAMQKKGFSCVVRPEGRTSRLSDVYGMVLFVMRNRRGDADAGGQLFVSFGG